MPTGLSRRALVTGTVVAATLVAGTAVAIRCAPVRAGDARVSADVVGYGRDHPGWTAVMAVVTQSGGTLAVLAVLVPLLAWLGFARRWLAAGYALAALLVPGPLTDAVKHLVGRHRPDPVVSHFSGLSFPSGHSAHVAADVLVVWLLLFPLVGRGTRRAAVSVGVLVVLAVGWSRIALGAHYPTDVLAGWALGTAWAGAVAVAFPLRTWCGGDRRGTVGDRTG